MAKVFDELSADALSSVSVDHYIESFTCFSVVPSVEVHRSNDMIRILSPGIPNWITNTVLHRRLTSENADEVIGRTDEYFYARNVVPHWRLCPGDLPPNLGEHLIKNGLSLIEEEPAMAVDLKRLNHETRAPDDFKIERLTDAATMKEKHIWISQFDEGKSLGSILMDMFTKYGFDEDSDWQHYIGILNDKPVSCGSVFYAAGVAGIYAILTLPEARQQGIGSAITLHILLKAREKGYRVGVLQSSAMGYNVYRRLGFETCFKIKTYAPPKFQSL